MPSRRFLPLLIAVLALLGARSAHGQMPARARLSLPVKASIPAVPTAVTLPPAQLRLPLPYMRGVPGQPRSLRAPLAGLARRRRPGPQVTIHAADWLEGSAGIGWGQHELIGTLGGRLFLF